MVTATRQNALDTFGTAAIGGQGVEDIIRSGGGDFELRKVSLDEWSGKPCVPGHHVVVRTDTNTAVGTVGESYQPLDNMEFFVPIANELVSETGARIDRFSMLDGGAKSVMNLSWGKDIRVGNAQTGDIVGRRAVITTGHDGKWAGKLILQAMRLVCSNGMTVPCGENEFSLTHGSGGSRKLADIVRLIPRISSYFEHFAEAASMMAETPILSSSDRCREIVQKIVDPEKKAGENKTGGFNRAAERVNTVLNLFADRQPGAEHEAVHNTAWGLFNAASDFYNHGKTIRGDNVEERRFRSLIPGKNGGPAARDIVRAWGIVNDECGITEAIKAATCN